MPQRFTAPAALAIGALAASLAAPAGGQSWTAALSGPAPAKGAAVKKNAVYGSTSRTSRFALMRAAFAAPFQDSYPDAPTARARSARISHSPQVQGRSWTASDPALRRLAVGVGGGTNGGSLEIAYSINSALTLRAQGAYLNFDKDFKSTSATYTGTLKHTTVGGSVDFHPFLNPFFVSGGVVQGDRKVIIDGVPTSAATFRINGVTYTASQLASVNGTIDLGDFAPVVGLGYDNTFTHEGHWGLRAYAGTIIGDTPRVALSATGPLASNAVVQSNLTAEAASVQNDARDYKYYPVLSLGLFYRF